MDIEIRPLKESDVPAIIELTKYVWGGHDHLPKIIYGWLSNPHCYPLVLDFEGEVAAVTNLKSIDDGMTGWMEGLRVDPDLRERGLAKLMTNKQVELAFEKGFKRIRLVTSTENPAPRKLAESVGMSIIESYSVFWKRYGRGVKWIKEDDSISKVKSSEVIDFIYQNSDLFQSTSLAFHWDVFDATKSNIENIGKKASFFIINNAVGKGLSLGFKNEIPTEPEWCFTVYASSLDVFQSMIQFHLKHAREKSLRDFLCIHQPEFKPLYHEIKWLKRRGHGIDLLLFERVF